MKINDLMKKELSVPSINMLGVGSIITGDIEIKGDLRIDCKVIGNILCSGKLLVGSSGSIEGTIKCQIAEISGEVKGDIFASSQGLVTLKETSIFTGSIDTDKLVVESGAKLKIEKCNTHNEILT